MIGTLISFNTIIYSGFVSKRRNNFLRNTQLQENVSKEIIVCFCTPRQSKHLGNSISG